MIKHLQITFLLLLLTTMVSQAQVLRPFAQRYYNPSVKGNIVYVSNSIVSSSGIGAGTPGTGEVPPGGTTWNNAGNGIYIDIDNPSPVTKMPYGSVWNYFSTGNTPNNDGTGNTWKAANYTLTGSWNMNANPVNGPGKYGYNSGQSTCLPSSVAPTSCLPGSGTKYITYYFRHTVNFTALELSTIYNAIRFDIKRDDGIVVYVNGVERIRNNMPTTGAITNTTLATTNIVVGAAENISYDLNTAFFNAGANSIAVEVHLNRATRTDMSFDMEVTGLSYNETYNSSSCDLNLAPCSNILYAGLYWGTGEGSMLKDSSWISGEEFCKLKVPGSATYTNITSTQTDYYNNNNPVGFVYTGYQCYADITALLNTNNPNGTYTVADVVSPLGKNNAYGGWTIVIAYGNPSQQSRNLTVFDGCVVVNLGNPPLDVNINGFLTPANGPVSCELGAVVYDGDRSYTDSFAFKQNGAPSFYNLTPNATANLNDMWNSVISYKGAVITARNPAFQNTLGYDASIIELPNASNAQLSNNQTSATVRLSSPNEYYISQVLTTAISQYNPTFEFDKTSTDINGGALVPGDILRYQINYQNVGNDSSTNTVILDNIPTGTSYSPGSIKINGIAKTDAVGDDQAEYDWVNNRVVLRVGNGANSSTGGVVGIGVSGTVQFDVITASSCTIVSCLPSIQNSARIQYNGKTSLAALYDSSGVNNGGCIIKGPVINYLTASCITPKDTVLVNQCNSLSVLLPWSKYAGYTFYSAMPFIPANIYNPYIPVTTPGTYWAYFAGSAGCSDTARISVMITGCPDIDDDNDGIPDYVEFNNPLALQDHNSNGTPNWNDPLYPGYVDHNYDNVNDNFDYGADSDGDGTPNFYDTDFPGFIDSNGDAVNDNADKDLDGIPNQYDLDSDNDGIPDVVESYGVDTNGNGIIDNYIDTDNDGFSQNVDANNTGVNGSNVGLGPQDFDNDGIPNYLDTDSDNDGIPDIVEVDEKDIDNNGNIDGFVDINSDGLSDDHINGTALLTTGPDADNNGRADSYPNKNKDHDFRPNAYDMDSDGDGIIDLIEAGFPDADFNGIIDGTIATNGWAIFVSSKVSLDIRFTDADPYPDYLDIDSDDDGIPDNVEGMSTLGYLLPTTTDTDGDGLMAPYDNIVGFGGAGIFVYDLDGDGTPDYRDLDTDADGVIDIIEGNDFNLNGIADDLVSLTGIDTDADGLDDRFDSLNSVINIKGTSYNMGNGGSTSGDASPGTRSPVQKQNPTQPDRDWRYIGVVLPIQFVDFSGLVQNENSLLKWTILTTKAIDHFEIERSTDNIRFTKVGNLKTTVLLNQEQRFNFTDDISTVHTNIIFYRLKVIGSAGEFKYSQIIVLKKTVTQYNISLFPNPAKEFVTIQFMAGNETIVELGIWDNFGKLLQQQKQKVNTGSNSIQLNGLSKYPAGIYILKMITDNKVIANRFLISK